jgi:hypothetical protein
MRPVGVTSKRLHLLCSLAQPLVVERRGVRMISPIENIYPLDFVPLQYRPNASGGSLKRMRTQNPPLVKKFPSLSRPSTQRRRVGV